MDSITVDVLHNKSIPTIHENFFEFVECDAWENEEPAFLTIDALTEGQQYYVFATTQNGLYRYFINDIVEVDGWFNKTPTIRFVQKGKGVTNLTGEKLYESQVIEAVQKLAQEAGIEIDFFMMLGCPDTVQYTLYVEAKPSNAVAAFEAHLGTLNIEFESKRGSGRLNETQLAFLKPGVAEKYKQYCIEQGQREGQFKLLKLQYVKDCGFDFSPYRYE